MTDGKGVNDILSSILENKELMNKISGIVSENKSGNKEDALPDIIAAISQSMSQSNANENEKDETINTGSEKNAEGLNISKTATSSFIPAKTSRLRFLSPAPAKCCILHQFLRCTT